MLTVTLIDYVYIRLLQVNFADKEEGYGGSSLLRLLRHGGETPGECGPRFDRIHRTLEAHRNAQRI